MSTAVPNPAHEQVADLVARVLEQARVYTGTRLAALALVTLPDRAVVPVRAGNTEVVDAWFAAEADRRNSDAPPPESTTATESTAAPDHTAPKHDVASVSTEVARRIADIVNACELCDAMQRARVNLHELITAMKERRLHVARDHHISRSALDGSRPVMATFPSELWRRVGEYLPEWDLLQLPAVARRAFVVRDDAVWGTLYERHFPLPPVPLPEGVTWRGLFLERVRRIDSNGHVPHLETFLQDLCPTGSVKVGTERMQIVEFSPSVMAVPQRHSRGMQARLEAFVVATARGPVVVSVLLMPEPAGPRANMRHLGHVKAAFPLTELKALFRRA